jgi:tetratricopeptide (TPR) repeat protein
MTRISGFTIIASPCCRTLYSTPEYGSINLSAMGYWTDGAKEHGLMPGGGGLRKCKCGRFYLLSEATSLGLEAGPETPHTQIVDAADLADATQTTSPTVELVARRQYWMHLNDPYRELYRAHRQAEDQAAQDKWDADWNAANPDQRSEWRKLADQLLRKKPAAPPPMDTRPFSAPPYHPSELQVQNMERLLELILEELHEPYGPDMLEVAELYRELGRFEEAADALDKCPKDDIGVPEKLMESLIGQCQRAPIRYRM